MGSPPVYAPSPFAGDSLPILAYKSCLCKYKITITAAQSLANTVSVTCKVIDDGEFTVPEEFASQLVFGGGGDGLMDQMLAMMNMIIFDRHSESPITGEGISVGRVSSEQLIMVNVLPTGSN